MTPSPRRAPLLAAALGAASCFAFACHAEPNTEVLLDPTSEEANQTAPDEFQVKFETTAGDFVVAVHRDWAPIGADRFYSLVVNGYYDGCTFFRVVPDFVVQFGLTGNPEVNAAWREARIDDDEVTHSNTAGRLTFATAGPNTRTTQLFINTANNAGLDRQGFAPFAEVVDGMDAVNAIYAGYGQRPDQGRITRQGDAYLNDAFPDLTRITSATIVTENADEDAAATDDTPRRADGREFERVDEAPGSRVEPAGN